MELKENPDLFKLKGFRHGVLISACDFWAREISRSKFES